MEDEGFSVIDWLRLIASVTWLIVFINWPQLTFSITLLAVGTGMIGYNVMIFWQTEIRHSGAPSVLPLFGGILAAIGIAILPMEGSWKWVWLPLALDWGGVPMLLVSLVDKRDRF